MNGFYGSVNGNIIGTLYFLMFQYAGFLYIRRLFPQKELVFRLLVGSVLGSVLLQWIPALFAFFFDFSLTAHVAALIFIAVSLLLLYTLYHPVTTASSPVLHKDCRQLFLKIMLFFYWQVLLLCYFVFCCPPTPSCHKKTDFM